MIQSTLKNPATITSSQIADAASATLNGGNGNAVLHSVQTLKNATATNTLATSTITSVSTPAGTTNLPEGSIIFQQRLNKNGSNDGPILLQTLKRIDKSPSILLFRNNTTTANTQNVVKTKSINNQITVLANNKDNEKTEAKLKTKSASSNVPLGAGK